MIKKIVFDTNIWLNFIEKVEIDYLDILLSKTKNEEIKIILPENIEKEYQKKLEKVRENTYKLHSNSIEEVNSIIDSISTLFNSAEKLKTIETGVNDWVLSKKAPNHNNKDNHQDTYILNTLLGLPENTCFYLVANDSDYRVDKNTYDLHPDIVKKFNEKSIEVIYHTDYPRFFAEANLKPKPISQNSNELYSWRAFKLKVKNKDVLQQLIEATNYYYKELNFIPLSYLSNIYPFNSGNDAHTYFNGTTLITNNKSLFDFFEKSLIQYKNRKSRIKKSYFGSDEEIEKYQKVLKTLNDNLIFGISFQRKTLNIEIKNSKASKKCDCYNCTLNRNEAHLIKDKCLNDNSTEPKDLLKKAYYYYKIGHFAEALKINNQILETVNKKNYPIVYFIAGYNKNIMRGMWLAGGKEFEEERKKIKQLNENKILKEGISSIIGYIKYSKFFDYDFFELMADYKKVKERYDAHNGIGSSFMSNIDWNNILRWSELYQFIYSNGIMFDRYTNIQSFAKYTLKITLLASIDRGVELNAHFYILKTTIPYIPLKDYKDCFRSLKIKKLNYNHKDNKQLFELFNDKINSLTHTIKFGVKHSYIDDHIKEIEKILYLQSHLSFSKKQDNIIISKIINLIKSNDFLFEKLLPALKPLAHNKIDCFSKRNAEEYIKLTLNIEMSNNSAVTEAFELLDKFKDISIMLSVFDFLLNEDIENKTGFYRGYILFRLYKYGSKEQKQKVLNKVHNILSNETTFDYILYNFFTSEDIIACNDKYLSKFKKTVENDFSQEKTHHHFSNRNDREINKIESLNYFIDHIYQFYDDEILTYLQDFLGRSDYYDFLINPNEFDLTKFDIHWFYIAYKSSFVTIKNIIKSNDEINRKIINQILESNNDRYYEAYLYLKSKS
ncbi:hypothetical protein [Pontimicrobium aquaticum]|uniref:DUF4935 domain-containing protein n=1 Tax=Pontimicrobium aquaticum TaxID=2565367 RepID=A0A4U0EVJ7_9FLAO|nr:hypothetical protein [Pontimicrobium aquaticum]TJY35895.1 hypothetical protein E5167_08485 [Pontimicrobium aquaticum]